MQRGCPWVIVMHVAVGGDWVALSGCGGGVWVEVGCCDHGGLGRGGHGCLLGRKSRGDF